MIRPGLASTTHWHVVFAGYDDVAFNVGLLIMPRWLVRYPPQTNKNY